MSKLIKLINSPFTSPIESALGLTFHFTAPYDKTFVTILVGPNVTYYKENDDQEGFEIRQVLFARHTPETKTLRFDFGSDNMHIIKTDGKDVSIKLMNIGPAETEGQEMISCELLVSEVE